MKIKKTKTKKTLLSDKKRVKTQTNRKVLTLFLVIFAIFFVLGLRYIFKSRLTNYVAPAKTFLFPSSTTLKEKDGRVNVLVLGKGGEGHESPDLTDTIIFTSVSLKGDKATLISIPRDIWINSLKAKVNTAYFFGKEKSRDESFIEAKKAISELLGQPVDYVVVIDFSGFKRVIDTLGGVEVEVLHSFTDNKYPIAGKKDDECGGDKTYACRYESITFVQGKQHMDGELALKFVRSRHAEGDEGTDFARAQRQQQLIKAIKEKVLTSEVLLSSEKVANLASVAESVVETDANEDEAATLAREFYDARENFSSFVISQDYLFSPPLSRQYAFAYVLLPKGGNWSKVQDWVKKVLP